MIFWQIIGMEDLFLIHCILRVVPDESDNIVLLYYRECCSCYHLGYVSITVSVGSPPAFCPAQSWGQTTWSRCLLTHLLYLLGFCNVNIYRSSRSQGVGFSGIGNQNNNNIYINIAIIYNHTVTISTVSTILLVGRKLWNCIHYLVLQF